MTAATHDDAPAQRVDSADGAIVLPGSRHLLVSSMMRTMKDMRVNLTCCHKSHRVHRRTTVRYGLIYASQTTFLDRAVSEWRTEYFIFEGDGL